MIRFAPEAIDEMRAATAATPEVEVCGLLAGKGAADTTGEPPAFQAGTPSVNQPIPRPTMACTA